MSPRHRVQTMLDHTTLAMPNFYVRTVEGMQVISSDRVHVVRYEEAGVRMQTPPPPWPSSSPFPSSDPNSDPLPTQPQRAPARSVLANPFDNATPFAIAGPAHPPSQPSPSQPPAHTSSQTPIAQKSIARPPQLSQPARSPAPDDAVYRRECLTPAQHGAAWQMVAQMRGAVTQERTRQRPPCNLTWPRHPPRGSAGRPPPVPAERCPWRLVRPASNGERVQRPAIYGGTGPKRVQNRAVMHPRAPRRGPHVPHEPCAHAIVKARS